MRRRNGESDYVCGKSVGKNNCYTYDSSYDSFVLYRDHFFMNLWFGSYGIQSCYYAMCDYCPCITAVE